MAVFVEVSSAFVDGDRVHNKSACAGNADKLQRYGATVPPYNLLRLFGGHRH